MKRNRRALSKQNRAVPSGSGCDRDGRKSRGKLALTEKVIYLDIKEARQAQAIEFKLKTLGAVIETFLSKDVNYVISGSAPARSSSQTRGQGQGEAVGPESPSFVNTPSPSVTNTPSPFSTTPSPTYKNVDGKIVPVTRGQAMAQIARARNRSPSPSSAVASAEKLGIKIISVEGAEKWLDKELSKIGHSQASSQEIADSQGRAKRRRTGFIRCRKLQHPYIKIESTLGAYRPQYVELSAWLHLNVETPAATCPFDGKGVTAPHRSEHGDKDGQASIGHFFSPGSHSATAQRRSLEGDDSSRLLGLPILTAGDLRRQRERRKKDMRRRGYCECCAVRYDNIDKHVQEQSHREFARDKQNYDGVDELMSKSPGTGEFLRNILLQHCAQQAANKPSTSTQMEDDDDQVITINPNTPQKSHQHHVSEIQPAADLPAPLEIPSAVAGSKTPTRTMQYSVGRRSASHSPSVRNEPRNQDTGEAHGSGVHGQEESRTGGQVDPGEAPDCMETGDGRSPAHLPTAVVIRRPGSKGILGSPRRRQGQGVSLSPSYREPQRSPKKVRERSMIFGDSSIGSLQPVPEESGARRRRDSAPTRIKDRSEQLLTVSQGRNRFRELSVDVHEPSTSRGSPRKAMPRKIYPLDGYENEVCAKEIMVQNPHTDRTSSQNIEEKLSSVDFDSAGSVSSYRESRSRIPTRTSTKLSFENKNEENSAELPVCKKDKEILSKDNNAGQNSRLFQKQSPVSEQTRERQRRDKPKFKTKSSNTITSPEEESTVAEPKPERPVKPRQTTSRNSPGKRTHQSSNPDDHQSEKLDSPLPVTPRRTPRKRQHSPATLSPAIKAQTPHKRQQELLNKGEMGSSPIYLRAAVHSSTPVVVTTRKLRNADGAIHQDADAISHLLEQEKPREKKSRRTIFSDESQPGSVSAGKTLGSTSETTSAETEETKAASKAVSDEADGRVTRRRSGRNSKKTEPHSSSQEILRDEGNLKSHSRSTVSCSTGSSVSTRSLEKSVMQCDSERWARPSLRMKLVRYDRSSSPQSSTKKVKLSRSWLLLSDNSMSRLLHSEPEASPFKGFQGDEVLPSDLTFEYASEVEVTDNEDREWLIDEEKQPHFYEEEESEPDDVSLHEFIPTFSSPGRKSDSSWDDACDLYLNHAVQQQLQSRQPHLVSPQKVTATLGSRKRKRGNSQSRYEDADFSSQITKKKRINKIRTADGKHAWVPLSQSGMCTPTKKCRENGQVSPLKGEGRLVSSGEEVIRVDDEVLFNYASPQKEKQVFSPLRVLNGNFVGDMVNLQQSPRTRSGVSRVSRLPPPFKLE